MVDLKFMYHVGMSGRGAAGLGKPMTIDELIAEMQRVFDQHEARMVNQMSKMMLAHTGFVVAVVGVAVAIIVVFVDK